MKLNNIYHLFFLSLFFCSVLTSNAIDRIPAKEDITATENEVVDSLPQQFVSFYQIAFGLSQRTDETNIINHSPFCVAKIYYNFTYNASGKFGIGYSTPNNFKSSSWETIGFRNLKLEIGFRWKLLDRKIGIYHENGIEYNYYFEPQSSFWEQRIGINLALGINFHVQKSLLLDISIVQSINDGSLFIPTKNINPTNSPIGLHDGKFFNETFNPTTIQILFFKKL